jgi:hypothetical protein
LVREKLARGEVVASTDLAFLVAECNRRAKQVKDLKL